MTIDVDVPSTIYIQVTMLKNPGFKKVDALYKEEDKAMFIGLVE